MVENARSESSSCGIVRRNLHAKTERCTLRARTHMAVCTLVCGCVMHLWRHVSCNKYGLRLSQFVLIRDQLNAAFVSDILFEDTSVIIRLSILRCFQAEFFQAGARAFTVAIPPSTTVHDMSTDSNSHNGSFMLIMSDDGDSQEDDEVVQIPTLEIIFPFSVS